MKPLYRFLSVAAAASLVLAACNLFTGPVSPPETEPPVEPGAGPGPGTGPSGLPVINLAGPQVGTKMTWVDSSILVYVPPGEFIMGAGEENNPKHVVNLSGFWIYRTKVTNRMYALCVQAGICPPPKTGEGFPDYRDPELANQPVVGVDWEQGQAYCRWIYGYLPTEAQWEKTARGPKGNLYPWGDKAPTCDLLNFEDCVGQTTDVTDYPAGMSFYEALDTAGNAFEWAGDWYDPDYYRRSPPVDPPGPDLGEFRVVRSSSFDSGAEDVPPSQRFFLPPPEVRPDLGFRCVVVDPGQFAPYCEVASTFPGVPPEKTGKPGPKPDEPGACTPPKLDVYGTFCEGGSGGVSFNSTGPLDPASVRVSSAGGEMDCVIANNRLVCTGAPGGSVVQVTICPADCEPGQPGGDQPGGDYGCPEGYTYDTYLETCVPGGYQEPDCPTGYRYNPQTGGCEYEPTTPDGGEPCPPGYTATVNYGCLPDPGDGYDGDGSPCPPGYYYDSGAETCVPPSDGGEPGCYGLATALEGAERCYPLGCLPGYTFDTSLACCRPPDGGDGPGCPPGYYYDTYYETCVPGRPDYPECPEGYTYDPYVETCVPGDGCPQGTYYDTYLGQCSDNPPDGQCPEGYYYDTYYETCVPLPGDGNPDCPPGYYYDTYYETCVPVPGDGQPDCPEGYYYDTWLETCVPVPGGGDQPDCPPGYYYDTGLQTCVPYDGGQPPCPPAATYASTELDCNPQDQCPPGHYYDTSQETCVPYDGGEPTCPEGYYYDTYLQTCVPGGQPDGGPGCYTLTVTIPVCDERHGGGGQCGPPGQYDYNESGCLACGYTYDDPYCYGP